MTLVGQALIVPLPEITRQSPTFSLLPFPLPAHGPSSDLVERQVLLPDWKHTPILSHTTTGS